MSSTLWLLLYLAPLLALTAAVFTSFGWIWRGSDLNRRIQDLKIQIEDTKKTLREAEKEIADAKSKIVDTQPDVTASYEHIENELHSLRNNLQATHRQAQMRAEEAAKAHEAQQALEVEYAGLLRDLDKVAKERDQANIALTQMQAELTHFQALPMHKDPASDLAKYETEIAALHKQLKTAQDDVSKSLRAQQDLEFEITHLRANIASQVPEAASEQVKVEVSAAKPKPKRNRATSSTSKKSASTAKRSVSLHETISTLEVQLALHKDTIANLTHESDDWQRRVNQLEGEMPADSAGLGIASRSLADSAERFRVASDEIKRLQHQVHLLHRAEEKALTLAAVADDDLTQIKGIKKVTNEQLRAHGIRTWKQIAQWDDEELHVFSELLAFKNRASREHWQEQARALHQAAHGPL